MSHQPEEGKEMWQPMQLRFHECALGEMEDGVGVTDVFSKPGECVSFAR